MAGRVAPGRPGVAIARAAQGIGAALSLSGDHSQAASAISGRAQLPVWFSWMAVDCSSATAALAEAALAKRAVLQAAVQAEWMARNQELISRWVLVVWAALRAPVHVLAAAV